MATAIDPAALGARFHGDTSAMVLDNVALAFAMMDLATSESRIEMLAKTAVQAWRLQDANFWNRVRLRANILRSRSLTPQLSETSTNSPPAQTKDCIMAYANAHADLVESHVFTAPPKSERRTAERTKTVLLIGKMFSQSRQSACLVVNISKTGMMMRTTTPIVVGQEIEVEVRGLKRCAATVRWVNGMKAGLQFEKPQNLRSILCLETLDGLTARAPRFDVAIDARIKSASGVNSVSIVNLSTGGAKLVGQAPIETGSNGELVLDGVSIARFGTIRWKRGNEFGFRFASALPLGDLQSCLVRAMDAGTIAHCKSDDHFGRPTA